jgi:DNA polymerase-3 subunit epsilon
MKIAITGETATSRAELVARAVAAGLNMMTSVSRHTSALVTNGRQSDAAKAIRAAADGVPIIDEHDFLRLLKDVRPGTAHETQPAGSTEPAPSHPVPAARTHQPELVAAPIGHTHSLLTGRRVLVLGGPHDQASAARTRIVELGGAAAVNLSSGVTDIVLLAGGDTDRRMSRIASLGLPTHPADWLGGLVPESRADSPKHPLTTLVLPRGGVIDLPDTRDTSRWTITAAWAQQTICEIDIVAFIVDDQEQVSCDEDFVFYGAPESPDGTIRLATGGPTEQAITIDLAPLPAAAHKIVIGAAIDGTVTFGDIGAIEITAAPGSSAEPLAQATLDAATTERTMLLAEIYRRGDNWRLRAVGQGYDHGLDTLARTYGVDIES